MQKNDKRASSGRSRVGNIMKTEFKSHVVDGIKSPTVSTSEGLAGSSPARDIFILSEKARNFDAGDKLT